MEPEAAAAAHRLFEICEGKTTPTSFSSDEELISLLERYPRAAGTLNESADYSPPLSYQKSVKKYALHAACWNNAPISVIQALLKAWPGAVRALADNNHCPLHEACIHPKCLTTIQLLVKAWPDSVKQRTSVYGFLPLQLALMNSEIPVSLDIVRFLVKQWPKSLKVKSDRDSIAIQYALQYKQSDDII